MAWSTTHGRAKNTPAQQQWIDEQWATLGWIRQTGPGQRSPTGYVRIHPPTTAEKPLKKAALPFEPPCPSPPSTPPATFPPQPTMTVNTDLDYFMAIHFALQAKKKAALPFELPTAAATGVPAAAAATRLPYPASTPPDKPPCPSPPSTPPAAAHVIAAAGVPTAAATGVPAAARPPYPASTPPDTIESPYPSPTYVVLLSVLNFMYHGEVRVAQKELESFLALAGALGVIDFTPTTTTTLPYPSLASAPPATRPPKPPYLMDIIVPVPPQYQALPTTTRPTYPTLNYSSLPYLASAPEGYPSPATLPTSTATQDRSCEIQHCPGCCCSPASRPPSTPPATARRPGLPWGITPYHTPDTRPTTPRPRQQQFSSLCRAQDAGFCSCGDWDTGF